MKRLDSRAERAPSGPPSASVTGKAAETASMLVFDANGILLEAGEGELQVTPVTGRFARFVRFAAPAFLNVGLATVPFR